MCTDIEIIVDKWESISEIIEYQNPEGVIDPPTLAKPDEAEAGRFFVASIVSDPKK